MEQSVWASLLSGVVGAGLSAVLVFIHNNKKNQLDYITSERAEWRKELKKIVLDIHDVKKRKKAIKKLETRLNPYGQKKDYKNTNEYYKCDGHIWDILESPTEKIDYEKLVLCIELLLKHDWERSKQETKFKFSNVVDIEYIREVKRLINIREKC